MITSDDQKLIEKFLDNEAGNDTEALTPEEIRRFCTRSTDPDFMGGLKFNQEINKAIGEKDVIDLLKKIQTAKQQS